MSRVVCELSCWKFLTGGSDSPVEVGSDQNQTLIENSEHYAMQKIANILKISKSSVEYHLHQLGYIYSFDVCIPHKWKKNFLIPISLCKHKRNIPFLWIKDLKVRMETIKLLEEKVGRTLSDINHSKILYDPPPRVMEIKAKINKWDLIKLKSFCTTKL